MGRYSFSCSKYFLTAMIVLFHVVFDDGDERTLKRTSLCLKGEKHFNESEVCIPKLLTSAKMLTKSTLHGCLMNIHFQW